MSNLSDLLPAGASAKSITATDSGSGITSGKPVILETAGTVTEIVETTTSYSEDLDQTKNYVGGTLNQQSYAVFNKAGDKICAVYNDYYASEYLRVRIGTYSGETISWGSVTIVTSATSYGGGVWASPHDENEFIVANDSTAKDIRTLTISSGTSFSLGTPVTPASFSYGSVGYDTVTAGKFAVVASGGTSTGRCNIGTIVAGAITMSGTNNDYTTSATGAPEFNQVCYNADGNVIVTCKGNNTLEVRRGVVSGDTVTFDTYANVESSATLTQNQMSFSTNRCSFDTVVGDYLFVYGMAAGAKAKTGSLSGSTWTFTAVATQSGADDHMNGIISSGMGMGLAQYQGGGSNYMIVCPITIDSSRVCTFGSETQINTNANNSLNNLDLAQWAGSPTGFYLNAYVAESPSLDRAKISFSQVAGSITTTNLTATNFLGIADEAISASASGVIVVQGGTKTGLSGFTIGSNIYVTPAGNFTSDGATYYGTGYDLAAASYASKSFSVASQESAPTSFAFKTDDGTKMYMLGNSGGNVYQYTLSTGFDISTASYDSVTFSISSQDTTAEAIIFNTDGTKMYMCGQQNKTVYQYSLSSGWDLSTASYDTVSLSVTSQDTSPKALAFNADGTKMFMCGSDTDAVYQYSLSSGFDLSTASYDSVTFSISSQESAPTSLAFSADGTKMFTAGYGNDTVYQYTLSGGFDLSTASYASISFSIASEETTPMEIHFNTDTPLGIKMFSIGSQAGAVYQYATSTVGTATVKAGLAISTTSLLLSGDS